MSIEHGGCQSPHSGGVQCGDGNFGRLRNRLDCNFCDYGDYRDFHAALPARERTPYIPGAMGAKARNGAGSDAIRAPTRLCAIVRSPFSRGATRLVNGGR